MVKGIPRKLRLFWHVIYSATLGHEAQFYTAHLHVLRPGARLSNKVHSTTVMKLWWDFAYVPKAYRWEQQLLFWYIYMHWAFKTVPVAQRHKSIMMTHYIII